LCLSPSDPGRNDRGVDGAFVIFGGEHEPMADALLEIVPKHASWRL
jgi:hypothetical protein